MDTSKGFRFKTPLKLTIGAYRPISKGGEGAKQATSRRIDYSDAPQDATGQAIAGNIQSPGKLREDWVGGLNSE